MAKAAADPAQQEAQKERDRLLTQAYGAANSRLRQAHRDEFQGYYAEEAQNRGVEWKPRQTPEQKAAAEFDALLEAYPHLRERVS